MKWGCELSSGRWVQKGSEQKAGETAGALKQTAETVRQAKGKKVGFFMHVQSKNDQHRRCAIRTGRLLQNRTALCALKRKRKAEKRTGKNGGGVLGYCKKNAALFLYTFDAARTKRAVFFVPGKYV